MFKLEVGTSLLNIRPLPASVSELYYKKTFHRRLAIVHKINE